MSRRENLEQISSKAKRRMSKNVEKIEESCHAALLPKSSASANSATLARK